MALASPPTETTEALLAQIQSDVNRYAPGLPDWVWAPLIYAESGFNPAAHTQGDFYGLLSIGQSEYPGASAYSAADLSNPDINLALGLPAVYQAWQQAGSPAAPSQSAYDTILTHSGHDTWTGAYANAADQRNFDAAFQSYMASRGSVEPASLSSPLPGIEKWLSERGINLSNPIPDIWGSLSQGPSGIAGGVGSAVTQGIVGEIKAAFAGWGMHALVFVAAVTILLGAGFNLMRPGADVAQIVSTPGRETARVARRAL
jgi:hypothetical protein